VSWTADELFITFYHPNDDRGEVIGNAMRFAHVLATTTFEKIEEKCGKMNPIRYDIGVASGLGLLGMLGPKHMKKTTIVGEAAGIAKRLEQEAAKQRTSLGIKFPILMVDGNTVNSAQALDLPFASQFHTVKTTTKDIGQIKSFIWCQDLLETLEGKKIKKSLKKAA
jgi:class 3 adenylate cyclase